MPAWFARQKTQEDRWQYVTTAQDKTVVLIDRRSIVAEGGVVTLWVRFDNEAVGDLIEYKRVVRTLQRQEYHCRQMMMGVLAVSKFDKDGSNLQSLHTQHPTMAPIVPDTLTESVWQKVCSG